MFVVRPAAPADAPLLAPCLRAADLREIQATTGESPLEILARGIASSDPCYTIVDASAMPVALFGAVPDQGDPEVAVVWLLASDALTAHPVFFIRHSRAWVDRLHCRYRTLWNYVDIRNHHHVRWLEYCGFRRIRTIDRHGQELRPFYEFESVRGD